MQEVPDVCTLGFPLSQAYYIHVCQGLMSQKRTFIMPLAWRMPFQNTMILRLSSKSKCSKASRGTCHRRGGILERHAPIVVYC